MESIKNYFNNPYRVILSLGQRNLLNWVPDELYLKCIYRAYFGEKLDLKNPKTYNQKLQWLKLNDRNPEYTKMVDKYLCRDYISEKAGEEYVIPLLGVWDDASEIDFDSLPNEFVLKCNNDTGSVIICRDKSKLDKKDVVRKLNKCMKKGSYYATREWPYKNVKSLIIAEKYMEDEKTGELRDYKIYTFNGKPELVLVVSNRFSGDGEATFDFFDTDYNHLEIKRGHNNSVYPPEKPENFELMLKLAETFSEGIPHLRVDFYEVNGKVYIGELTFYPNSGLVGFEPTEWDKKLGDMLTVI